VRALIDTGPLEPREIGELCRISSQLAGVLSRMEELAISSASASIMINAGCACRLRRAAPLPAWPQIEANVPRHRDGDRGGVFDAFLRALDETDRRNVHTPPNAAADGVKWDIRHRGALAMNTGTAFPQEHWYVAAWSHEIGVDGMLGTDHRPGSGAALAATAQVRWWRSTIDAVTVRRPCRKDVGRATTFAACITDCCSTRPESA